MFGIGTTELIIIMLVALIILGPKQLPGIARSLGKALGEFRRVTTDVQRTLNLEAAKIEEEEREKKKAEATPKKVEPKEPSVGEAPAAAPVIDAETTKPESSPDTGKDIIPPLEHADPNPYSSAQAEASANLEQSWPASEQGPSPTASELADPADPDQPPLSAATEDRAPSEHPEKSVAESSQSAHSKVQA